MSKPPFAPPRAPSVDDLLRAGLQLHQAGRVDEARTYYERVLQQDGRHPAANHLLGLVFLARGDASRAIDFIGRAVKARPGDAQYLGNLGVALNAASRHKEAVEALARAVSINPGFAEAYSNLGMAYRALMRLDDAVAAYSSAIELRPNEPGFHANLGNTLRDLGDVLAAEQTYRRALVLQPGHPGAAQGLGGLLDDRWAAAEGLEIVDQALAGAARHPQLHVRRGRLLQNLGRLQEAVAQYDRAIELNPNLGEPYQHRANLLLRDGDAHDIPAMERLFADAAAPLEDRVFAGFGLGQALAWSGDHRASVEVFQSANRLHRQKIEFSLERATQELEASYDESLQPSAVSHTNTSGDTPAIFIVGLPRAGKSTVEAILARHPDTAPMGELPIFGRLFARYARKAAPDLRPEEQPELMRQLGQDYLDEARRLSGSSKTIIDTLPSNYRLIAAISNALPAARIIWCERAPTEHCIGIFEKYLVGRGHEYAFDLDELVPYHAAYRQLLKRWQARALPALRVMDVARLRQDRLAETRELLTFCGLSWNDACLADVESEPLLTDWTAETRAANRAEHLAAWCSARPDVFPIEAGKGPSGGPALTR